MSSEILRVAILPKTGIFNITIKSDGSFNIFNGYEAGLLQMILQGFRTNYELSFPRDGEWGRRLQNGSWTGLIGMIERNESDMAVGFLTITQERMKVVTFSYPYKISEILFATKMLSSPTYHALIRPFDSVVWTTILAALVLLPLIIHFLSPKRRREKYSTLILRMIGTMCQKSVPIRANKTHQKLFFATWLISSMLLSTTYISLVSSFMTVPLKRKTLDTVQELADAVQSGSYACATLKGAHVANEFASNPKPSVKIIGQYIIDNKGFVDLTSEDCEEYLSHGNRALIMNRHTFATMIHSKVSYSKDYFYAAHLAVATSKKFKYRNTLEKLIHKTYASGILHKDKDEYDFRQKLLLRSTIHEESRRKLHLKDFFELFILLLIGHLFSVVVFLMEIIYNKFQKF